MASVCDNLKQTGKQATKKESDITQEQRNFDFSNLQGKQELI